MRIVLDPWLSVFAVNLRDFRARQTVSTRGVPQTVVGFQKKSIAAKVDFFVKGSVEGAAENVAGSAEYRVAGDQSAGFDRPPVAADLLLPDASVAAVSAAVDAAVRTYVKEPTEQQLAKGPVAFMQLNRLHINLPYNDPRGQFVVGSYGAYDDVNMVDQMVDAGMEVLFCTDEYLSNQFGSNDPEALTAIRLRNGIFHLHDFFGGEGVIEVVGQTVGALFAEFKAKCDQWAHIDVDTVVANVGGVLTTLATPK